MRQSRAIQNTALGNTFNALECAIHLNYNAVTQNLTFPRPREHIPWPLDKPVSKCCLGKSLVFVVRTTRITWVSVIQIGICWYVLFGSVLENPHGRLLLIHEKYSNGQTTSNTALQTVKVVGSIPDGVIEIFHWHNPSGRTMVLVSTQVLTEMSTRNISGGKGGIDSRCCHWNLSLTQSFRTHYGPGVDSASNRYEYQVYFLGVKAESIPDVVIGIFHWHNPSGRTMVLGSN
jgi:hypothetical protein